MDDTIATGRSRRSNAGHRMKELIQQQIQAGLITVGVEEDLVIRKPAEATPAPVDVAMEDVQSNEVSSQIDSVEGDKRIDIDFRAADGITLTFV
jgi:hypothetical protein